MGGLYQEELDAPQIPSHLWTTAVELKSCKHIKAVYKPPEADQPDVPDLLESFLNVCFHYPDQEGCDFYQNGALGRLRRKIEDENVEYQEAIQ